MKKYIIIYLIVLFSTKIFAQNTFPYNVVLTPITITNLPGLHSYAFAQHD
jgi:hypothetical protein